VTHFFIIIFRIVIKPLSSTTVFTIDNNNKKMFLEHQSSYYNDYWRMWHWRLE